MTLVTPRRSNHRSLPRPGSAPGRSVHGPASVVALLLTPLVVLLGGDEVREFLNFGAGVLSLVSPTCSVVWGLVAQDRIFLDARRRLIGQAVHRTTAVASIAFLLLHVLTKITLDHTEPIAALVPFALGVTGLEGLIGLGSAAGLLMIFVSVTGALRGAFASPAPVAARWRAMHMLAYPAWCAALVHGLYAGRAAKPVFVFLYGLCVLGVLAALALRAAPRPVKRQVADRVAAFLGTGEPPARQVPDAGRARTAEPAASGTPARTRAAYGTRPEGSYRTPGRQPANGFAAAYRAVSPSTSRDQGWRSLTPETPTHAGVPPEPRPTEPRVDGGTSAPGTWPIPSPPPVGEAPRSSYDPLTDTGHTVPAQDDTGTMGPGPSDPYNTGEAAPRYGTYYPDDTRHSGPAMETPPGSPYDFGAPGPSEPWNPPSGGPE